MLKKMFQKHFRFKTGLPTMSSVFAEIDAYSEIFKKLDPIQLLKSIESNKYLLTILFKWIKTRNADFQEPSFDNPVPSA